MSETKIFPAIKQRSSFVLTLSILGVISSALLGSCYLLKDALAGVIHPAWVYLAILVVSFIAYARVKMRVGEPDNLEIARGMLKFKRNGKLLRVITTKQIRQCDFGSEGVFLMTTGMDSFLIKRKRYRKAVWDELTEALRDFVPEHSVRA